MTGKGTDLPLADSFSQRFFIVKRLPEKFLESLNGIEGFNKDAFVKIHESGEQVTSIRINPNKLSSPDFIFSTSQKIPWTQNGYYLKERPSFTFDPLFHAGCYYVQEASSMFLEQALLQLVDMSKPLKVLDLCAAPGGKSTHIQSLISSDSLLVSNEIIRSRNNILVDNIIKWGCANVFVSNNDASSFKKLEGYFDVIMVDAPCSGSGLFRKDEEAIDEWSLNNVKLCSQRQQRILADALPALKENGIFVYSTCSYSKEEDEDIMDWLVQELGMENLELRLQTEWNIVETHSSKTYSKGYRFYPDKVKGEGLFLSCFRKINTTKEFKYRSTKLEKASKKEADIIQPWLKNTRHEIIRDKDSFFTLPGSLEAEYAVLKSFLNLQYKGAGIGKIMKDRLVPDHSLALSMVISGEISFNEVIYDQAIKYLQRQDVNFETVKKGWQLIQYKGHNLGWINVLPNRINNYYPKELRILKQQNNSAFEK
jgi:16S rRNA C967 or C1407 C5-methylase (RsmB/RsmF family)/NOL1/NOP2/fmu family ribosome biogenesis protein